MADYVSALLGDLVEQFRGKPHIEALVEVIALELQQVYDFYEEMKNQRDLYSSVGSQLDGVGDIAVLSRGEAAQYAGLTGLSDFSEEINDDTYRKYLIYKVLKNTCNCTYPDIIKAFRLFWDKPLYYSEDPEYPAVMFLKTDILSPEDHAENLLNAPVIKAAGVGIHLTAITQAPTLHREIYAAPYQTGTFSTLQLPGIGGSSVVGVAVVGTAIVGKDVSLNGV